jgi:hypothetical protein
LVGALIRNPQIAARVGSETDRKAHATSRESGVWREWRVVA